MTGPTPSNEPRHVPVLPAEVLTYLTPTEGQIVVDATIGAGGHSRVILERLGKNGRLIGLDQDAAMLELARQRLNAAAETVTFLHRNFAEIRQALDELAISEVDAVLADLGVCSDQLDETDRGFSFQVDGPLDMRLDAEAGERASDLLNEWSERDLADVFWKYGEERFSRRIARKIIETRRHEPLRTTTQLAELVRRSVPRQKGRRHPIHPATRVFQALRIAVNDELGALEKLLNALPHCLKPGGRAVIISFHSLEDRRVKQAFRHREMWEVLTRKPVQAQEEEVRDNPRARSAKLRAARKLGGIP
jgi:16S rRNA (cytosine1402-N4)-methyltransferase